MLRSSPIKNWLSNVEAMEERLEGMKLSVVSSLGEEEESIVRATSGLLEGRLPSGVVFQGKIRREWKASFLRRAA
jgi:hypothetical protein